MFLQVKKNGRETFSLFLSFLFFSVFLSVLFYMHVPKIALLLEIFLFCFGVEYELWLVNYGPSMISEYAPQAVYAIYIYCFLWNKYTM